MWNETVAYGPNVRLEWQLKALLLTFCPPILDETDRPPCHSQRVEAKRGVFFEEEGLLRYSIEDQRRNSALYDLTGQRCGFEPSRKYRSQSRLITLVRSLTRGIFHGLRTVDSACRCVRSHKAGLELEARHAVIVPTDVDNDITKGFDFHVALSSEKTSSTRGESPLTTWISVYASVYATDNKLPEACVTSSLRVVAP